MKNNRRQERQPQFIQKEEAWSVKPSHNRPHQDPTFHQQNQLFNPNNNWPNRNRRARVAKPHFFRKSELGQSNSELGCSNSEEGCSDSLNFKPGQSNFDLCCSNSEAGCSNLDVVEELGHGEVVVKLKDDDQLISSEVGVNEDVDDVACRLEQMELRGNEADLSEDQMNLNDQLQEDELLAMKSIYGDNALILDRQRGLQSIQVHIHIETPDEISISRNLSSSNNSSALNDGLDVFSYSFKVQYLPPIVLTCLLPKSYPSHLPPYFTISAKWLDSNIISKFCSIFDSIWNEQQGQEVIYQWVEWLQCSSLSYLGFEKEITLGPYGVRHVPDRRAISGSVSPDVDIHFLKRHNDERCEENFVKNFHQCCICYSEYAGTEFVKLPCQHFYCWKCMQIFTDMHVKEGTLNQILCPEAKCDTTFPPSLLQKLLGEEQYERWETLTLERTLSLMSDVTDCPRCETACIEDEDHHAQCPKCFFSFCGLCDEKRHVGISCMTPELKLQILQNRQNSSQLKADQKAKVRDMINEILSVKEILRDAKQCPSCQMAISRIEGCNKMTCKNCGKHFCYVCNMAINGYDHFSADGCEVFPQEMIQAWERNANGNVQWDERINDRQRVGQIQAELNPRHGQTCPNCGQFNGKVGNNNHMFCWSCQSHYCYLCKQVVRRAAQHYGSKGCKQHSAD